MTLKIYWDFENQPTDIGNAKKNAVPHKNASLFTSKSKADHIFPQQIRKNIQSVSGSDHGKYYYPIGFDCEIFRQGNQFVNSDMIFQLPDNVIEDVKQNFAKILCVNTEEGFPLDMFDDIIEKKLTSPYSLDWENFVLLTSNCLEVSPRGVTNVYYNAWEEVFEHYSDSGNTAQRNIENIFSGKERTNKFICLQRRPKEQRLLLYSKLYPYKNTGILTQGTGDKSVPVNIHQMFDSTRHWFPKFAIDIKNNLKLTLPRKYDVDVSRLNPVDPFVGDSDLNKYENSYLHIVSETYFLDNPNQMFFSEKIIKPFIFLQPFVLFAQKASLKQLKELGYKTFHPIIDESYDDIIDHQDRFGAAFDQVLKIIQMSNTELNSMLYELSPILLHNYFNLKRRYESAAIEADEALRKALAD